MLEPDGDWLSKRPVYATQDDKPNLRVPSSLDKVTFVIWELVPALAVLSSFAALKLERHPYLSANHPIPALHVLSSNSFVSVTFPSLLRHLIN